MGGSYVKSPVASFTFVCSSVRNRVRVTILVFTLADSDGGISPFPLAAMIIGIGKGGGVTTK